MLFRYGQTEVEERGNTMKVLRRLAALGAALAVSATLAVSASAAPAPPSPAQVTAAVVACLSHTNCAAALSRATGAIGACGRDTYCSARVRAILRYLPSWAVRLIHDDIAAAIVGGANPDDLAWLLAATAGGSDAT
jgi:hypothetical protein